MRPQTRRARLLKLADYLTDLPKSRKFNMSVWGRHEGKHPPEKDNYCGTTACALGHAAMIPSFRRVGLKLIWSQETEWNVDFCEYQPMKPPQFNAMVTLGTHKAIDAGAEFFGLSYNEANDVFHARWRSRAATIKKLRQLAARKLTQSQLNEVLE